MPAQFERSLAGDATDTVRPTVLERFLWTSLLVIVYLTISAVGWHHALIHDEIGGLLNAGLPLDRQMASIRLDLMHPPLMFLLERVWMYEFGQSDNAVKALVTAINVTSITVFSLFAARVLRPWKLASLLVCTAYLQIGGVPNLARGYSLGLLLTVVSLMAWERWRVQPTIPRLALWASTMVALAYTHYVGALFIAPFIVANWFFGSRRWLFALTGVMVGLALLPWALAVYPTYAARGLDQNMGWVETNPWLILGKLPFHFLAYLPSGWNPFGENGWPQELLLRRLFIAAAGLAHLSLFAIARRRLPSVVSSPAFDRTARCWSWTCVLLAAVPLLALVAFSLTIHPVMDARYVVFILPVYWMLIAFLVDWGGREARLVFFGLFAPFIVTSILVPLARGLSGTLHENMHTVAAEVEPGDLLLCDRLSGPQVYWEWTRALHRDEPVVIASSMRSDLENATMPFSSPGHIDTVAFTRVWLFATSFNPGGKVGLQRLLEAQGFKNTPLPSGLAAVVTLYKKQ